MSTDPTYEYNAPQFVDFEQLGSTVEDNVEDYFNYDHENGRPVFGESIEEEMFYTPAPSTKKGKSPRRNTPRSCRSTPKAIPKESPKVAKENVIPPDQTTDNAMGVLKKATESGMPTIKPVLANLCTDVNAWRSKPTINTVVPTAPPTKAATKPTKAAKLRRKSSRKEQDKPKKIENKRASDTSPAQKRHKRSASVSEPKRQQPTNPLPSNPAPKKHERTASSGSRPRKHLRTASVDMKAAAETKRVGRARTRTASVEVPLAVRSTSANSKKNTSLPPQEPKSKVPKLTMPATPSFMKRKPVGAEKPQLTTEELEMAKIKAMRKDLEQKRKMAEESHKQAKVSHSYVPKHSAVKPTQPFEYKFKTDERIKDHGMETRQDKEIKDFTSQLRHNSPPHTQKPLGPTKPQPFEFHERKRKRTGDKEGKPYQFESMAEKMIAFARKTPDRFRMKPKNTEMLHKSEKNQLTVPKTPQLMCRKRSRPVAVKSQAEIEEEEAEEMKRYKFQAQPVNEEILKHQVGVKKVPRKELTKPMEVEMETDRRLAHRHENNRSATTEESESNHSRSLRGKAFTGIPFLPKYDHKVTEMKPFSFDEKDRDRFAKKEQKIKQVVKEEKRAASEFRAQPIPDLSPVLPSRQHIPPTQPEPFKLSTDNRGAHKADEWNQKVKEELKQQRAAANFHARPNHVVHKKPFIPHKSTKPLTDLGDIELNTERRAEKRAEFDAVRAEHEQEAAAMRAAAEAMRAEEERREYERQRAAAVHRAAPIKKFRRVDVKPSDRPLTQPVTPRFSTRLRTRPADTSNDENL